MAGVGQIGIANIHMHRDLAGRTLNSPNIKAWGRQIASSLRACETRVICGDANKAVFILAEVLRAEGLLVELVAHHSELATNAPVNLIDTRGVRDALRRDTCGIWMVGGVTWVRSLTLDSQCLAGAVHPCLLERDGERFRCYQRGFKTSTFAMPPGDAAIEHLRASEVPNEVTLRKVAQIWAAHDLVPLRPGSFEWRLDASASAADEWVQVASALPKPGEEWQALTLMVVIRNRE